MRTALRTDYDCGDLILVPDGDGWILGLIDQTSPVLARWGDCERVVTERTGQLIFRRDVRPEIGKYIGTRFLSLAEAQSALRPYLKVPA